MPDDVGTLYSRGELIAFVHDALRRGRRVPAQALPIVLLTGTRGAGSTVLLEELDGACGAPCVRLGLAHAEGPRAIVFAITQVLRHGVPRIGEISLPRVRLAFKALNYSGAGGADFTAYLHAGGRMARLNQAQQAAARRALGLLVSPQERLTTVAVSQALDWMLSAADKRRDAKAFAWHQANGVTAASGEDALWQLHQREHDGMQDSQHHIARILCLALLADLWDDFNHRHLRYGTRRVNCLLLLDRAGTEPGEAFLRLLADCRSARSDVGGPLLVVADWTGRAADPVGTPLATAGTGTGFARWCDDGDRAALARRPFPAWQPERLTDLERQTVTELVRSQRLGERWRDADFVHDLTGGNPKATAWLVRALEPEEDASDPADLDPRDVLDRPSADGGPGRLADSLLRLLPGGDGKWLDAMAVCAATRGLRQGACESVFAFLGWPIGDVATVRERLEEALWAVPAETGVPGDLELRPLPRLALSHRLAARRDLWEGCHQGFVNYYGAHDAVAVRRHTLALAGPRRHGELTPELKGTVRFLAGVLDDERVDTARWLATLAAVTAAPNRLRDGGDQRTYVTLLAGPAEAGDRERTLGRVVVALWLFNDRLFDPARWLADLIADELNELARPSERHSTLLFQKSREFRQVSKQWGWR